MPGGNESTGAEGAAAPQARLTGDAAFALAEAWHGEQWQLASQLYQNLSRHDGGIQTLVDTAAGVISDALADSTMVVLIDLPDRVAPVYGYVHRNSAPRELFSALVEALGADGVRELVVDVTTASRHFGRVADTHDTSKPYAQVIQRHLDELGVTEAVYAPVRHLDGRTRGLVLCTRDPGRDPFNAVELMTLGGAADGVSLLLDGYLARQAEAATNRYWSTAFETGPFGKIVLDRDRTYIRVNAAACQILGVDRWALLGQRWPAETDPDPAQLEEDLADIERARLGLPVPDRLRLVRLPGAEPVWIQRSIATVVDEAGDVELFHVQFVDVTALRTAEAELASLAEQRRLLLSQLVSAEQAERHRIAHDVHDDSIQLLAAAQLRMQLLVNQLTTAGATEARAAADTVSGLLTTAQRRLRQLLLDLEPPSSPGRSLDQALRQVAEGFFDGTDTAVRVSGTLSDIPDEVAAVFYRAAREALSNVQRHADASVVTVTLSTDDDWWTVTVVDDGVGVPEQVQSAPGHLGLRGMHSRIEALGGTCTVLPLPDRGTEVVLSVPRG